MEGEKSRMGATRQTAHFAVHTHALHPCLWREGRLENSINPRCWYLREESYVWISLTDIVLDKFSRDRPRFSSPQRFGCHSSRHRDSKSLKVCPHVNILIHKLSHEKTKCNGAPSSLLVRRRKCLQEVLPTIDLATMLLIP